VVETALAQHMIGSIGKTRVNAKYAKCWAKRKFGSIAKNLRNPKYAEAQSC